MLLSLNSGIPVGELLGRVEFPGLEAFRFVCLSVTRRFLIRDVREKPGRVFVESVEWKERGRRTEVPWESANSEHTADIRRGLRNSR